MSKSVGDNTNSYVGNSMNSYVGNSMNSYVGNGTMNSYVGNSMNSYVGNGTNSIRTTDRRLGVARAVRRSEPLVRRRGRE